MRLTFVRSLGENVINVHSQVNLRDSRQRLPQLAREKERPRAIDKTKKNKEYREPRRDRLIYCPLNTLLYEQQVALSVAVERILERMHLL